MKVAGYDIDIFEQIPDGYEKTGASGVVLSGIDVVLSSALSDEQFDRLSTRCLQNTVSREKLQQEVGLSWVHAFDDSETITVPAPSGVGGIPERLSAQAGTYKLSKPYVCTIDGVNLFGAHGVVKTSDGRVVLETALARKRLFKRKLSMRPLDVLYYEFADALPTRTITSDPLVPMVWGYGNYHH